MKFFVTLLALALSTNAFATKARLIALGQDKNGSFHLDDSRQIFQNASYINKLGNLVVTEWGKGSGTGKSPADADYAPKAEGGVFHDAGQFAYGVYLGSESDTAGLLKSVAANSLTTMPQRDNVIHLFVGGEHAIDWGLGLLYASNEVKQTGDTEEDDNISVLLGLTHGDLEAYVNLGLKTESIDPDNGSGTRNELDGKLGTQVGVQYAWGNHTFFGEHQQMNWDAKTGTQVSEGKYGQFYLGWAHKWDTGSESMWFTELKYYNANVELKYTGSTTAEIKNSKPSVTVGFETPVKSWLTLRGSVTQVVFGQLEEKNLNDNLTPGLTSPLNLLAAKFGTSTTGASDGKRSFTDSTAVNAGATLTFGKLNVDGVIGYTGISRTANPASSTGRNDGVLSLDNLMTRVAATYAF